MKFDDIQKEAEVDLKIDQTNLSKSSAETPLMVNKYYRYLMTESRILKLLETEVLVLHKETRDYYLHQAPDEVYVRKPFNRKVLKADVKFFVDADPEYCEKIRQYDTQERKVKYLEEIIKQFNNRSFIIQNIIADNKFKNGGF